MPTTPQRKTSQNGHKSNGAAKEPSPPFPRQHQRKPGLESAMNPRPRYAAQRYRAAGKLEGKVALITGGDSGIGRAITNLYAREGADVAIVFLEEEMSDAQETKRIVEACGRDCLLIPGDLTEREFCDQCVERVVKQFGKIDILVSNAAYQNRVPEIAKVSDEEFDKTFRTNIYALFYLCRAAARHMQPGSAIIATSSETGLEGAEKLLAYSATKGAINALAKTLSMELVEKGVRVNAVAPGPVWTPLNTAEDRK